MYLKYKMEQPMYMFTPEDTNMVDNSSTYVYSSVYSLLADFGSYLRSKNHSLSNAAKVKDFSTSTAYSQMCNLAGLPQLQQQKERTIVQAIKIFPIFPIPYFLFLRSKMTANPSQLRLTPLLSGPVKES